MKWLGFVLLLALGLFAIPTLQTRSPVESMPVLQANKGDPSRGAYLARISGCIACHTDTDGGGKPLAGGAGIETAYGTFYAPNLSSDELHGIGAWTQEQFAMAVREGISPENGAAYYPAFPYTFYTGFSDQDMADLWAAFQTVPPADVISKEQDLAFPFNLRSGLRIWQRLYFDSERFPVEDEEATDKRDRHYQRGAYLVEVAGHCAACHTRRNIMGALDKERWLQGAEDLPGGGDSPPITAEKLRSAGWTKDDLAYALDTGIKPDGDVFGAAMAEVVSEGTTFMRQEDRMAIAEYLFGREDTP